MRFEDWVSVRLGDPLARQSLFDTNALNAILNASYNVDASNISAPSQAIFKQFSLGGPSSSHDGCQLHGAPAGESATLNINVAQLTNIRIDALWAGEITAQASPSTSRIKSVTANLGDFRSIDEAIVASSGGLPSNPDDLENARFAEIRKRLSNAGSISDHEADAVIARLLSETNAGNAHELAQWLSSETMGNETLRVAFEETTPAAPEPFNIPVAVAFLVRDVTHDDFSMSRLMHDTRRTFEALRQSGFEVERNPSLAPKRDATVAWLVSEDWFEDEDWPLSASLPASERAAGRRDQAATWLADEGIALMAVRQG